MTLPRRLAPLVLAAAILSLAGVARAVTPLPDGSVWSYRADGTDLGTSWRTVGYDDSGWASGPAPLGYGETDVVTVVPSGPAGNQYITSYFRVEFTLPDDPADVRSLFLYADYDDGFVAYLNGAEVARRELPGGAITYPTTADSHESGSFEALDISPGITHLVPGTNLLAVELHQRDPNSSDLFLDMELFYTVDVTVVVPLLGVWNYDDTGTDRGAAWRATGYDDSGWGEGPAILGYGEPEVDTVVDYGPDPADKHRTTYFRYPFTVAVDPAGLTSMFLDADFDDGFVAYLNGQEIARASMPGGAVTYSTYAFSHESGSLETFNVSPGLGALVQGPNVLAVEVHQTSNGSSDLVLDMELYVSDLPALVTRGPYLQRGAPDQVTLRWRTDAPTDSRVRFGTDPGNPTRIVDDATSTTEHEVVLTGLDPSTRYFYDVGAIGDPLAGGDSTHSFTTPPVPGTPRPVRVWAIGDAGTADANARSVRDGYHAYAAATGRVEDLWLMLGDNAYNTGTDSEYQAAVFDTYPSVLRRSVLWPTRGNHDDLHSGIDNDYYEIFTMPTAAEAGGLASGTEAYYSFDHANVHFVCLDSDGSSSSTAMATWLEDDLAATAQPWVIAFWHHPPYTKGSHDSDDPGDSGGRMRDMREVFLPILEAGGVDLVLTGHSHSYERSYLLDGHHDVSSTLQGSMILDSGDGDPSGDGAYEKPSYGLAPHEGAVYVVAGSSGKISGGTLDHPVMAVSLNRLGSVVIDIEGNQLDARFLDTSGNADDVFSIVKGSPGAAGDAQAPIRLSLAASHPNPFSHRTRIAYELAQPGPVAVTLLDVQGREVRRLEEGTRAAGAHEAVWDGRDGSGRRVSSGVYFAVLEAAGERRVRKLVLRD